MYGLFECMSSGCVAQKGDHAKIFCQVIQGWDRTLAGHLNSLLDIRVIRVIQHKLFIFAYEAILPLCVQ